MKKIGSESEMFSESSFRQWPLFKGIRKEEKFKLVFEEIFGHSFTEYTTKEVSDETKHIQENFNENLNIES
jgi:hypothetical protein